MKTLGIIGTAGRKDDYDKLTNNLWNNCKKLVLKFVEQVNPDRLVSGGAAFSDHLSVQLFNKGIVKNLTLYLPTGFDLETNKFEDNKTGNIANYYHKLYTKKTGRNSLLEISQAINKGAIIKCGDGFFARNTKVAADSDILLAITFGDKEVLKDGGTADTMKKYIDMGKSAGYHLNLNDMILYSEAKV